MITLAADIETAASFGDLRAGGSRLAWTPELFAAYRWLSDRLRSWGLDVTVDPAGNLIGRWQAGSGRAIVVGSHLDTVPCGGCYDGTLGVLAGAHAIRMLQRRGFTPARPVWLVAFMDEEGARFGEAMVGSRAMAGEDLSHIGHRSDVDGELLADVMSDAGFDVTRLADARAIDDVGAYVELHIEQGPVLERKGADLGIVTGIVGLLGLRATFRGQASHAGTTPMDMRRDALVAAASAVLSVREHACSEPGTVATVGTMEVAPGAFNVVPGHARLSIDVRSMSEDALGRSNRTIRRELQRIARGVGVECQIEELQRLQPVELDQDVAGELERAARAEAGRTIRIPSGAGHDAMVLARHVPAGMLFVPSREGLSHNPAEFTDAESCDLGARVLARAIEALAS